MHTFQSGGGSLLSKTDCKPLACCPRGKSRDLRCMERVKVLRWHRLRFGHSDGLHRAVFHRSSCWTRITAKHAHAPTTPDWAGEKRVCKSLSPPAALPFALGPQGKTGRPKAFRLDKYTTRGTYIHRSTQGCACSADGLEKHDRPILGHQHTRTV